MGIITSSMWCFIPQLQFNASLRRPYLGEILYCIPHFLKSPNPSSKFFQKAAVATEAAGHKVVIDVRNLLEHQQELGNGYLPSWSFRLNVPRSPADIARGTVSIALIKISKVEYAAGVIHAPALSINGTRYRNALEIEPRCNCWGIFHSHQSL